MKNMIYKIAFIALFLSCGLGYSQNIRLDLTYLKMVENGTTSAGQTVNEKLMIDTINKKMIMSGDGYPDRIFRILKMGKFESNGHLFYYTQTTNKNQQEGTIIIEQDTFYKTIKFVTKDELEKPLESRTYFLYNYK